MVVSGTLDQCNPRKLYSYGQLDDLANLYQLFRVYAISLVNAMIYYIQISPTFSEQSRWHVVVALHCFLIELSSFNEL